MNQAMGDSHCLRLQDICGLVEQHSLLSAWQVLKILRRCWSRGCAKIRVNIYIIIINNNKNNNNNMHIQYK